jgi:hypothetical protein
LDRSEIRVLTPLSTTFDHILAQQADLSNGKFQRIGWEIRVLAGGRKKYNLFGHWSSHLQHPVLTCLIQVARDVLVNWPEIRQAI